MKSDLLSVVESAYDLAASEKQWLQGITNAVGPLIDAGYGAYGMTIDSSDPKQMRVGDVVSYRGHADFVRAIQSANSALPSDIVMLTYKGFSAIATATERVGVAKWNEVANPHGPAAIRDCAAVVAADTRGIGCMVNAPLARVHRYPQRVKRVWARVVAHIVAIQRLRGSDPRADGDAVLSPNGKIEHATGDATNQSARTLLRSAAVAREKARGRLRTQNPEEAVEMWQALVAGRWSIVDRFDRDGKRFLIAHENEPQVDEPRALTARERQILTQAARGHSNKLIAYELGLSLGAVSRYLSAAMKKLGLRTRVDAARLFGATLSRQPP